MHLATFNHVMLASVKISPLNLFLYFSIQLGQMKVLNIPTQPGPDFRYIVADDYVKGNYLVVFGYAIFTTSDFIKLESIGGVSNINEYANGRKDISRFGYVNGIVTSPKNNKHIWLSDLDNNCFREINRVTNYTSYLTGGCREKTVKDGKFDNAKVAFPFGMITSTLNDDRVYFLERKYQTLKCLIRINSIWYVNTLIPLNQNISGLTFNPTGAYLYFTTNSSIMRVSSTWKSSPETILSGFGHNDGAIDSAKMREPKYLHFLDNQTVLLTDYKNHVLRVVDLAKSRVSTICRLQTDGGILQNGLINTCRMQLPRNLAISKESLNIYVIGDFSIYELKYSGKF